MKPRTRSLVFPAGGVHRKVAYRQQPPFTSPDARNVRADDVTEGRERGGQRPGLVKGYDEELGSGSEVRLLGEVSYVSSEGGLGYQSDDFSTGVGPSWSKPGWMPALPSTLDWGQAVASVSAAPEVGAVRSTITEMDHAAAYYVELYAVPYELGYSSTFQLFAQLDNTTPDLMTDGLMAQLRLSGSGAYEGELIEYVSGAVTINSFSTGTITDKPGRLVLEVDSTTAKVYWHGVELVSATVAATSSSKKRVGFGLRTSGAGLAMADYFRVQYSRTDSFRPRRRELVASAGGTLYRNSARDGSLSALSASATLASDRLLHSSEVLQKLYVADHGDALASGSDGVVTSTTTFDSATYSDWTTLGISTHDHLVEIDGQGTFPIASIASGTITLSTAAVNASGLTFRIVRGIKVYDPVAGTLTLLAASAGTVPANHHLVTRFRNRLVVGGGPHEPHNWHMSKSGDPTNWDYGAEVGDVLAAVAGNNADAGQIGEPLTALISWNDDNLIFGCRHSLWKMTGDPLAGGRIDNVSEDIGIVGAQAWCRTPENALLFLSADGIYGMSPRGRPESLSRERLPDDLRDLNPSLVDVLMAYDVSDRGAHIFLTYRDSRAAEHWWFDWEAKSFWPMTYDDDHAPTSALAYKPDEAIGVAVLMGGRDGYIRAHNRVAESDDGTVMESYIMIGAVRPAGEYRAGRINEFRLVKGERSGPAAWSVHSGTTPEEATRASASASGSSVAGRNLANHPRVRGGALAFKILDADRQWSMERLEVKFMPLGRQRSI